VYARQREEVSAFVEGLTRGVDYGHYEAWDEDILLKSGAEKFALAFELVIELNTIRATEDFVAGMVHYVVKGQAFKDDKPVATGFGSCNSHEPQYRYKQNKRLCPDCGQPTILRSKYEDEGGEKGWYCWTKIGGCGSEFPATAGSIINQVVGSVPNADIAATYNTVLKIAAKRAYVDTVIRALGLSDLFTQDEELAVTSPPPPAGSAATTATSKVLPPGDQPSPVTPEQVEEPAEEPTERGAEQADQAPSGGQPKSSKVLPKEPETVKQAMKRKVAGYALDGKFGIEPTDEQAVEVVEVTGDVGLSKADEQKVLQFLFDKANASELTEAQMAGFLYLLEMNWFDTFRQALVKGA